jgi:hypothetical protein
MDPATRRATKPRRIACAACGTAFTCDPDGACWCADEAFRLPVPAAGADCLCPACLRAAARDAAPNE